MRQDDISPAALLEKMTSVADSNEALRDEIRIMSGIFGENQEILVAMKGMIDTLASTLEGMQKQSERIDAIEDDTKKIHADLSQMRTKSDMIARMNDQAARMQGEIARISKAQESVPDQISQGMSDNAESIRNNSSMIIKIAKRIDEVRDDLRRVSGKADSIQGIMTEMDGIRTGINEISDRTEGLEAGSGVIDGLRNEIGRIAEEISSHDVGADLAAIRREIDAISSRAAGMDSMRVVVDGLKGQFESIRARADAADRTGQKAVRDIMGKIDGIESKMGVLSQRADSTAFVGEGLRSVQEDLAGFKESMLDRTGGIDQKISAVSDALDRQDAMASEFHKKSDRLFSEIQSVRSDAARESDHTSREVVALLKLSEYQSKIRMSSESRYGGAKELERMAAQTAEIVNMFDRTSIESGGNMPLPHEVRQWAVGRILDCADRWEVRFGDVYSILTNGIGRDMLKESIRIRQVREIYGIRAVDEIRQDLNIS